MDKKLRQLYRDWQASPNWTNLEQLLLVRMRSHSNVISKRILDTFARSEILPVIWKAIYECMGDPEESLSRHPAWLQLARVTGYGKDALYSESLDNSLYTVLLHIQNFQQGAMKLLSPKEWKLTISIRLIDDLVRPTSGSGMLAQSTLLGDYNDAFNCLKNFFINHQINIHRHELTNIANDDYDTVINEYYYGLSGGLVIPHNNDTVIIFEFNPTLKIWGKWLSKVK